MNSIERVKATLKFEETDKVPLGHCTIDCDIAGKVLGRKTFIRDTVGTQMAYWEGRRDEVVAGLIQDIPELFGKLDIYDLLSIGFLVPPKGYHPQAPKKIDENTWEDEEGRVYKYSEPTNEIHCVHDPHTWEYEFKLEDYDLDPDVEPPDESTYEVVDAILPKLPPDKYLIGPFPLAPGLIVLGGWERGMIEIADHPEVVERAIQAGIARTRKEQKFWRNDGWQGVMDGYDLGHTTGTFVSPATFRRLFLPALKFNADSAHAHGLDFFKHSCGDNKPILDQFVEAGIDCEQSLQPQAGMDPALIKQMTGNSYAVWGGVDVANLVAGTPEDVRADVRRAMEMAKPGGGFILGPSHSVAFGTKYDNFVAMLDEFEKLRDY